MFQSDMKIVILFVAEPLKSGKFYSQLFEKEPIEEAPTFVLFHLKNDLLLGLWSRTTAEPKVKAHAGASEVAFYEEDVDGVFAKWQALNVPMQQQPCDMDFGRTFVALDPDGHRIRVFRFLEKEKETLRAEGVGRI